MDSKALTALTGPAALTQLAALSQEAAELGQRVQALADKVAATIDTLAPAVGVTVEDVFRPLQD
jgi:hypothetical protein